MLNDVFGKERVQNAIVEAVTKLCRNGLQYSSELSVEGLIGITLDNKEVLLVNIKEVVRDKPDGGFYHGLFGTEAFSSQQQQHVAEAVSTSLQQQVVEASQYDTPLDFSSKMRSSPEEKTAGNLVALGSQDLKPVRASRKRKPKHISESKIFVNDDDDSCLVRADESSGAVVDFSTRCSNASSRKLPEVPSTVALPVTKTSAAEEESDSRCSFGLRGGRGLSPALLGSACLPSPSPSPSSPHSGTNTAMLLSPNSSIPQQSHNNNPTATTAALVTQQPMMITATTSKKPKLHATAAALISLQQQVPLTNDAQTNSSNCASVPPEDFPHAVSVQDKIGHLIQSAVKSVVERARSHTAAPSKAAAATTENNSSLLNALETAVRTAHANSYNEKHSAIDSAEHNHEVKRNISREASPASPTEPGRLVIVEPSDDTENCNGANSSTENSATSAREGNGGLVAVKKEEDDVSSGSSSRSLQNTPDPTKQQPVSFCFSVSNKEQNLQSQNSVQTHFIILSLLTKLRCALGKQSTGEVFGQVFLRCKNHTKISESKNARAGKILSSCNDVFCNVFRFIVFYLLMQLSASSGAQFVAPNAIINPSLMVPVFPGQEANPLLQLTAAAAASQHPLSALQVSVFPSPAYFVSGRNCTQNC